MAHNVMATLLYLVKQKVHSPVAVTNATLFRATLWQRPQVAQRRIGVRNPGHGH